MSLLLHCCMKTSPNTVPTSFDTSGNESLRCISRLSSAFCRSRARSRKRSPFDDLTDAELDQLEEYIAGMRDKTVTQLELVANNEEAAVQLSAEDKDATQPIHEAK